MKVLPVSFLNFKSQYNNPNSNYNLAYLYTLPETKKKNFLPQFAFLTGLTAIVAVAATLFNISGRKRFPYSIAEIADMNKGLNKLKGHEKLTETLKTDFVYPINAFLSGDKKMEFKSGLILTGNSNNILKSVTDALNEHFAELKFKTIEIPHRTIKTKDGKSVSVDLKRNEINKHIFKEINNSQEIYKKDGTYTVINLGNLDDLIDLKVVKSHKSNLEKLISNLSENSKDNGIIWLGWTDKQKDIPLFLSYLPVLIKKVQ